MAKVVSLLGHQMAKSIKVGDRVRSFDFDDHSVEGERACYVEGVVEAIIELGGCDRYKIKVAKRVFGGATIPECSRAVLAPHEIAQEGYVYPPVNGTPTTFGGVTHGVEKIG